MARSMTASAADQLSEADCQEVARVAYECWEKRGCTHGSDQLDWFEAERIVRERKAGRSQAQGTRSWRGRE